MFWKHALQKKVPINSQLHKFFTSCDDRALYFELWAFCKLTSIILAQLLLQCTVVTGNRSYTINVHYADNRWGSTQTSLDFLRWHWMLLQIIVDAEQFQVVDETWNGLEVIFYTRTPQSAVSWLLWWPTQMKKYCCHGYL